MVFFFFFHVPATTEIYTLSLHDALPIYVFRGLVAVHARHAEVEEDGLGLERVQRFEGGRAVVRDAHLGAQDLEQRSEEHTSELQSRRDLVCRLLLEKKKKNKKTTIDDER